ncbi:hypothetical protein MQE36_11595 [Zhouia spongiae]|uniref:Uncharacterized protein n=1 Tax=Zhouia spongiae TaxID=2202721 RepID=A0ABY3YJC0_9FLAO|nr:hypothetical protein [Zhouia spongiae]UNY97727.1 hypothetical protein MQE36_11595 [Zhouia spongiae]
MITAALIAAVFFSHIYFPSEEIEVSAAYKEFSASSEKVSELKENILDLSNRLALGVISKDEFVTEYGILNNQLNVASKNKEINAENYNRIREENKVVGFSSRHKFIWCFSIGFVIFTLAIDIMISSVVIKDVLLRRGKFLLGLAGGTIGGYFITWVFYPANDLPFWMYTVIMVLVGLLASLSAYFIGSLESRERLKEMIRYLTNVVFVDAKKQSKDELKYINDISKPTRDYLYEQSQK